nr:putative uncharacterized protein [uncultured bacterium]
MTNEPKLKTRAGRFSTLGLMVLITIAFGVLKLCVSEPLLGLSAFVDFYALALLWVGVLWLLGVFGSARPEGESAVVTLDNLDWHLESVRKADLPESRAASVGGLYLSWLIEREGLIRENLVGLDESISLYLRGGLDVAQLYEDFGGKLTTDLLKPQFSEFSLSYLEPSTGAYFDDLELVLGVDAFGVDPGDWHVKELHRLIDQRFESWKAT